MKWTVTISKGFTFEEIQLITKPMKEQKYICQDCKTKLYADEIIQHPDYEQGSDKEVWGDSCPHCLGEIKEIS